MSRIRGEAADSLELLLDTITNAFGGILFVTVLVTLLFRISHPKDETIAVTAEQQAEMRARARELSSLISQIKSLELAQSLVRSSNDQLGSEQTDQLFDQYQKLKDQQAEADVQLLESRQVAAATQVKIDEMQKRDQTLDQDLTAAEEKLQQTERELAHQREVRTQDIVPPKTRLSRKEECCVVLRYGRIYTENLPPSGLTLQTNFDDFVITSKGIGGLRMTPNPVRGVPLVVGEDNRTRVARKLQGFNNREYYICICAWDDSFRVFRELKQALIDLGYEYRLIMLEDGNSVYSQSNIIPHVQ